MLPPTGTLNEGENMTEPSGSLSSDDTDDADHTDNAEGHMQGAEAEQAEGDDDVAGHMQPPPDLRRDR
jgi:hypothetical protein